MSGEWAQLQAADIAVSTEAATHPRCRTFGVSVLSGCWQACGTRLESFADAVLPRQSAASLARVSAAEGAHARCLRTFRRHLTPACSSLQSLQCSEALGRPTTARQICGLTLLPTASVVMARLASACSGARGRKLVWPRAALQASAWLPWKLRLGLVASSWRRASARFMLRRSPVLRRRLE